MIRKLSDAYVRLTLDNCKLFVDLVEQINTQTDKINEIIDVVNNGSDNTADKSTNSATVELLHKLKSDIKSVCEKYNVTYGGDGGGFGEAIAKVVDPYLVELSESASSDNPNKPQPTCNFLTSKYSNIDYIKQYTNICGISDLRTLISGLRTLCRGKRSDHYSGNWVVGDHIWLKDVMNMGHEVSGGIVPIDSNRLYTVLIIYETLGSATGYELQGKLVFEDDVLKEKKTGRIFKVVLEGLKFRLVRSDSPKYYVLDELMADDKFIFNDEFELLGNIHDNPELIK